VEYVEEALQHKKSASSYYTTLPQLIDALRAAGSLADASSGVRLTPSMR